MKELVLAVDLGGTNLRMAAINADGEILYRTRRDTPRNAASANDVVSAIIEAARECRANLPNYQIDKIAAAVPGTLAVERGMILTSPNLPALNGFRISAALEDELNIKALLENDANAAALGEAWLGASKDYKNSICVTLGTGIGGGIILDGKILRGVDGTAGEIGHVAVEPFGAPCGCGSRGCVEQYASATAIVRLTRELGSQYPKSDLHNQMRLTAGEVFAAGRAGDELALEVFRQVGFYLGVALASLINVLNPEIIVLCGGAAEGWSLFMPRLEETIKQRTYCEPAERAKIVKGQLGDDAGLLGAAYLVVNYEW